MQQVEIVKSSTFVSSSHKWKYFLELWKREGVRLKGNEEEEK